jgi:hypothetical protein
MLSYLISCFFEIIVGPKGLYRRCHFFDDIDEFGRFGRGYPGKTEPSGLNTHVFHKIFKESEFSPRIVITFQVMALAGMSPGDPDSVSSLRESGQKKLWAHAPGARNSYDPDVRRVFHSSHSGKIRSTVTAPVA